MAVCVPLSSLRTDEARITHRISSAHGQVLCNRGQSNKWLVLTHPVSNSFLTNPDGLAALPTLARGHGVWGSLRKDTKSEW